MTFARAVITTEFSKDKYRPLVVNSVEDFFVDSAMDSDADQWSLTVGVATDDMIDLLKRDNEVRVALYGLDRKKVEALHRGFADEIWTDESGSVHLTGRDVTAPAQDSQAFPKIYKNVQPEKLVAKQCRELKIGDRLHLANIKPFKKVYTDGSETYWEFWYRIYRHRQMWLWAEPDGYITANFLNYREDPTYMFGQHKKNTPSNWIPVETVEWRKTTTSRVYDVQVFGQRGDAGFVSRAQDPTIREWVKRPAKIIETSTAHNEKEAKRMAWEEIFETKVGAIEITLTVANPGFIIRQNRMARINIPHLGLGGVWYIVGTRMVGGPQGVFQEVRLRERNYAITRRVPEDPQLRTQEPKGDKGTGGVGKIAGIRWSEFFWKAAKEFHGLWSFPLFLATLIGMCKAETGFHNYRVSGNIEWYNPPSVVEKGSADKIAKWRETFANENPTRAVGPMQLYDIGFKHWADDYGDTGRDEFLGGRWVPEHNIRAGARALVEKLHGLLPKDENIWIGVRAYNGAGPAAEKYMRDVKHSVETEYLPKVQVAIETSVKKPTSVTPSDGTNGYPLAVVGRIMGGPGEGSHSRSEPPNNWESDEAVDISIPEGTPVLAVANGLIEGGYGSLNSSNPRMAGLRLHLKTSTNEYYYAHLKRLDVKLFQSVKTGQQLGLSGSANGAAHLHFAAKKGDPRDAWK